MEVNTANEI